jgi:hypothetical protein
LLRERGDFALEVFVAAALVAQAALEVLASHAEGGVCVGDDLGVVPHAM